MQNSRYLVVNIYICVIVVLLDLHGGHLVVETGSVSNALTSSQERIPHTELLWSALVQGEELVLPQFDMPCFAYTNRRFCPF